MCRIIDLPFCIAYLINHLAVVKCKNNAVCQIETFYVLNITIYFVKVKDELIGSISFDIYPV